MADRFGYGEIGLDIHPCRGCEDYDAPDGCKSNGGCGMTQTNADRIRAMVDEELMTWIMEMQACPYELYQDCQHPNYDCETCIKDWMKQEAE